MSEDMPASSWRYLGSAGSKLSSLKGYISGRDSPGFPRSPRGTPGPSGEERQSWRAWAGQKLRGHGRNGDSASKNEEFIHLFPGWAARRYLQDESSQEPPAFGIDVSVSGFASTRRGLENSSRSQRAFVRLAKGFASLPKLVESSTTPDATGSTNVLRLTPSTEELLAHTTLPPRPEDLSGDLDVEALEEQFQRAKEKALIENDVESESSSSSQSSLHEFPINMADPQSQDGPSTSNDTHTPTDFAKRLHDNLEKRLQMLWYSVLPNRTVRLHLFVSQHSGTSEDSAGTQPTSTPISSSSSSIASSTSSLSFELNSIDADYGPLASADVTTAADGSFQFKFQVKWEDLCQHPRALHIAYGDRIEEQDLLVVAQLLPPPMNPSQVSLNAGTPGSGTPRSVASGSYFNHHYRTYQGDKAAAHASGQEHGLPSPSQPILTPPPILTITRIPVTYSPIRVVSDIDDTVKFSGILGGARAAFHNVFVKDLKDGVIPGMGEWYMNMYSRGIRFHYVSNGPFSVLPVLNEFFEISQLPPGSIKLKSYAGRSIFNGLLSAPAARKRVGVVEVLESFPDSRFFLIGDTGEQDLELYTELAKERPHQILGVFLRDADTLHPGGSSIEPPPSLDDPIGARATETVRPHGSRGYPSRSDSTGSWTHFWSRSNSSNDVKIQPAMARDSTVTPYSSEVTPRPNRHAFEDANATPVQQHGLKYATGPLTAEPESSAFAGEVDLNRRLTARPMRDSGRIADTLTPRGGRKAATQPLPPTQGATAQQKDDFVTRAPKPIPAPSIKGLNLAPNSKLSDTSTYGRRRSDSISSTSTTSSAAETGPKTDIEKRRLELQLRVYRSRMQIPAHIPLRVFRNPEECVEINNILDGPA